MEETLITSQTNKRVAAFRRLRGRRVREATGLYWAEGIRIVVEAVELGVGIESLVVAPALLRSDVGRRLVAEQQAAGTPCLAVSPEVFASLSAKDGPQGLAAVLRQEWVTLETATSPPTSPSGRPPVVAAGGPDRPPRAPSGRPQVVASGGPSTGPPLWTALHRVRDPGNLGTIVRTSDAVGGRGVILLEDTADPHDPTSVRASMGALFAQRLVRTGFGELAAWAGRQGYVLVGTSGTAGTTYDSPAWTAVFSEPVVLVLGGERQGLPANMQAACDLVVRIPMTGRCDSLNLAVAAGILLYEIRRRREWPGQPD